MKLFRGYVPTNNKQCTRQFKNKDVLPYDQIKNRSEFAGVLSDDAVLIDVDDAEQSELLMNIVEDLQLNCRVTATTRGKHFFFRNVDDQGRVQCENIGNHKRLACGLEADVKTGIKNGYAIVKFNGEERFIEWTPEHEGEYDVLPCWLRMVPANVDFLNMDEGDGRNNALFSYILTLQSNGFTVDECRETIRIINDYILDEPLDAVELEKILRDESFDKEIFFVKGKFLFDVFAEFLKNRHRIVLINNQLHVYKDGIYSPDQKAIEALMIKYIKGLKDAQRNEVLKYLRLICPEVKHVADARYIAFKNGVYDVTTGELLPFSPDIVLTNKLACDYNPNAYNETIDKTLNKLACDDPQIRALLEECVGYCFYRRNELGKAFILTGEGANGKSTFIDMIKTMLGDENIASLDLKELGDRFKTAELYGKLANVGDDIGDEFIANASVFKKLVTGERVSVERKGQDPFEFNNYSKFLFSANNIPRMRDKTGAVQRRLTIIPFEAKFSKEDADYRPFIKYDLREQSAVERLILLGIEGLKRVIANNAFTKAEKVDNALKEYEEENNSIISFVNEFGVENIENEPTKNVYAAYSEFCFVNGLKEAYSNISFSKQIQKRYGFDIVSTRLKSENNMVCRVFKKRKG